MANFFESKRPRCNHFERDPFHILPLSHSSPFTFFPFHILPLSHSLKQRDYPLDSKKRIFLLKCLIRKQQKVIFWFGARPPRLSTVSLALSWARKQYSKAGNLPFFVGKEELRISGGKS